MAAPQQPHMQHSTSTCQRTCAKCNIKDYTQRSCVALQTLLRLLRRTESPSSVTLLPQRTHERTHVGEFSLNASHVRAVCARPNTTVCRSFSCESSTGSHRVALVNIRAAPESIITHKLRVAYNSRYSKKTDTTGAEPARIEKPPTCDRPNDRTDC